MVDPDSPKHVVLYALLRRFSIKKNGVPEVLAPITPKHELMEEEYPVKFYGDKYVSSTLYQLKEKGHIERATVYGTGVGWTLTDEGADVLDSLGTPTQYDH